MSYLPRGIATIAAATLISVACTSASIGAPGQVADQVADSSTTSARAAQVSGPTVLAVGDIACAPGQLPTSNTCQQAATAALAQTFTPDYVLGLGDLQYETGALSAFRNSYDQSWGALKKVTKPVPGNHEYRTPDADGYFTYFDNQQPGRPGYYAFNVDRWRIYALNSNCTEINCRGQLDWMRQDMSSHPRRCSAISMHHPRYSSGGHGNGLEAQRFWKVAYRRGVDLALAGHDHDYERFRRMDPFGVPARDGLISFVSGLGGKSLYGFGDVVDGSLVRYNENSGVLALTLGAGEFAFEFKSISGDVIDEGVRTCL